LASVQAGGSIAAGLETGAVIKILRKKYFRLRNIN
jgi:hypothetical protein